MDIFRITYGDTSNEYKMQNEIFKQDIHNRIVTNITKPYEVYILDDPICKYKGQAYYYYYYLPKFNGWMMGPNYDEVYQSSYPIGCHILNMGGIGVIVYHYERYFWMGYK